MSQTPSAFETMQGYSPPSVTQLSVFLDNRVGKLLDMVEAFEDHPDCTLCALSVHEASDFAVVRLITNHTDTAKDIIRNRRLSFCETEVLVVELESGHSLGQLCLYLLSAELNIKFAYPLMTENRGATRIALAVDDLHLAGTVLRRKGFALRGECDLLD
jgi:hypothetical protein